MKANSFLYQDQKLIEQLKKIAQQGISAPPAPTTTNPDEDMAFSPNQIRDVAKKLVDNLIAQQNSPSADFTADKSDTNLSTKHLKNLSNLLNFLENNGIETDGLKLVLKHMPEQGISSGVAGDAAYLALPKEQQAEYMTYPKGQANFQYYVFKNGIIKYLQHLQSKASAETPAGRVLRPYVAMLIEQIQSQLGLAMPKEEAKPTVDKDQGAQKEQGTMVSNKGDSSSNQNQVIPAVWHPGQPLTAPQMQLLGAVSNVYPFLPDRIDFRWIDEWLNSYIQVAQTFRGANLSPQNAMMAKQYVQLILGWGIPQQALTSTAVEIYTMAKLIADARGMEPNAAMAFPWQYLQATQKLALLLENTLLNFKSIFYPSMPQDWKEDLDKQVDNSASSLAAGTKAAIQQWINNLPAAQKQVERGMR